MLPPSIEELLQMDLTRERCIAIAREACRLQRIACAEAPAMSWCSYGPYAMTQGIMNVPLVVD